MAEIIKALTELLREVGKMAGGRIRGQIAFWVIFALIVAICTWPAYQNIKSLLDSLHISVPPSFLPNFLIALGFSLITLVLLTAIGFGIGALLSAILILFFGERIERSRDEVLSELLDVVGNAKNLEINAETKLQLENLYSRVQQIQEKQHKRLANKIIRWSRRKGKEKKVTS